MRIEKNLPSFPDVPALVHLDSPVLRLFPREDPVLTRWFDELQRAMDVAQNGKRLTTMLMKVLAEECPGSQRMPTLSQRVLYVCYDMLYRRNVAVNAVLVDDDPLPVTEEQSWMTFGLRFEHSSGWIEAADAAERLVVRVAEARAAMQKIIRDDLISEVDARKRKADKRKEKQRQKKDAAAHVAGGSSGGEDESPSSSPPSSLREIREEGPEFNRDFPLHFSQWWTPVRYAPEKFSAFHFEENDADCDIAGILNRENIF